MKKKLVSLFLAVVLLFSLGTTATAAEMSAAGAYRNEASQISRDAVEAVLQKYAPARGNNVNINRVSNEESDEAIAELFSERNFATLSGATEKELARIDAALESYGVYSLTDEDMATLFPESTVSPLAYGPPTEPNDTDFVKFYIRSGTTSQGTPYTNLFAECCYAPEGVYETDSLPLYNCRELNVYPSKTNYTEEFLKKTLQFAADEGIGSVVKKKVPGILLAEFANIAIENFFVSGQSFGARSFAVTSQVMVFSYLADVPNYYTHYMTAEQCNMMVVYYFSYNQNGKPKAAIGTGEATFNSDYFTAPQNKAQSNLNNGLYMRDGSYCGDIDITYPTMENTTKTVSLSRQYYSELYSIPGI